MNDLTGGSLGRKASGVRSHTGLLWLGFILVSLNLRLMFSTVGPLLNSLHLSFSSTLLVTTLPLILLSAFSVTGVWLRQRMGEERGLFLALILLCLGCLLRGQGEAMLLLGTAAGTVGIAVMNVIMPALARKRFAPQQMGTVMGIYALMLGLGAFLGAGGALPLWTAFGGDEAAAYRSLSVWTWPALLALVCWLPQLRHRAAGSPAHGAIIAPPVNVYRQPVAWSVTLFFGLQVLNLYVFLGWMPTLLSDRGASTAAAAQLFTASQFSLVFGGFLVPMFAARSRDQRGWIALTILLSLAGTLGVMYASAENTLLWALLLGFGQGAGPGLAAYLFVARAASGESAARLSAMAQSVGYLIAALGPLLVGYLWQWSGGWDIAAMLLTALLIVELLVCLSAGKNVRI